MGIEEELVVYLFVHSFYLEAISKEDTIDNIEEQLTSVSIEASTGIKLP